MSYRFMRVMLFFDLPTLSDSDRREYRRFRKYLIKSGFLQMQESVYSKIVLNTTAVNIIVENIRKHRPAEGLVQVLVVTEKQFGSMEYIVGERSSPYIDSDERLIILGEE